MKARNPPPKKKRKRKIREKERKREGKIGSTNARKGPNGKLMDIHIAIDKVIILSEDEVFILVKDGCEGSRLGTNESSKDSHPLFFGQRPKRGRSPVKHRETFVRLSIP